MIAEPDILCAMKELNLVRYYKKDYCIIEDRTTINRVVRQKYKLVVKCPFVQSLLCLWLIICLNLNLIVIWSLSNHRIMLLRGPAAKLNKKNEEPIRLIIISGITSRSFVPYSSIGASEQKNSSHSI